MKKNEKATIVLMLMVLVLTAVGCNCAVPEPSAEIKEQASGLTSFATTLAAHKLTSEMTLENTQSIMTAVDTQTKAITTLTKTLEASLVKSGTQPSGGDPAALQPPAKNANDSQTSTKIVAEPGAVSQPETLVQLATRLYARGVNTHMKTEDQLKAIDAQLNGGAPVTGAIFQNNRTGAVTSQRSAVRLIPRGRSRFWGQTNSAGKTCGPNGCY